MKEPQGQRASPALRIASAKLSLTLAYDRERSIITPRRLSPYTASEDRQPKHAKINDKNSAPEINPTTSRLAY